MDLTNEQWSVIEPLIGELPKRTDGRDLPNWRPVAVRQFRELIRSQFCP
jgi:hypothetical protein